MEFFNDKNNAHGMKMKGATNCCSFRVSWNGHHCIQKAIK